MKRITVLLAFMTLFNVFPKNKPIRTLPSIKRIIPEDRWMLTLMDIESNRNPNVPDNLDAVGVLQIRPIMVRDLNDREGYKRFKLSDRRDSLKSVEMFKCFIKHYNVKTLEQAARKWNGGPNGMKKKSTIDYYNKAKKRYPFYYRKTYREI